MSLRRKGDVEWVPVSTPDAEGLEVGIRHVGPGLARQWAHQVRALLIPEAERVWALRERIPIEAWPELHEWRFDEGEMITPEGLDAIGGLAVDILASCVAGARGGELAARFEGLEPAGVAEELRALGMAEALLASAVSVQRLRRAEVFAEGHRNGEPRGAAPAGGRPGGGGGPGLGSQLADGGSGRAVGPSA